MNKKLFKGLLFILALGALYYFGYHQSKKSFNTQDSDLPSVVEDSGENSSFKKGGVPSKVYKILEYIDTYEKAPNGYVGGRRFGNFEQLLPQKNRINQKKINYREWDVNKNIKGKNRGVERLVTGDDKSAYYTKDHYKSFQQIR